MSDHEAVLFANEAFYTAFKYRDVAAMEDAWATVVPVTCIHPGWDALHGREEVMASWSSILSSDNAPEINCWAPRAHIYGQAAVVICFEEIAGDYLIATNVFAREGARWRMVHHHAAPTDGEPPDEAEAEPNPIN